MASTLTPQRGQQTRRHRVDEDHGKVPQGREIEAPRRLRVVARGRAPAERDVVRGRRRRQKRGQRGGLDCDWTLRVSISCRRKPASVTRGEELASALVAGAEQPYEEMLGFYRWATEPEGLVACEEQGAPGTLGVAVEHLPPSVGL